jgi:glycosyltransferase involved in cell wall biosynthesis
LSRAGRRLPLVVSFHGPWADESRVASRSSRWLTSIKRSIERTHYRRATSLVTLSAAFAELLNAQYGVSRGRIHVVRPGVDLDHFRPGDRVRAREELGWDQGTFAAVSVRRLTPRMGLEYLLDAWSQLPPSTHLYIAGQGSDESRLRALILRLGLEQSVTLVGGVSDEDLTRLYVAADISVVPSVALEGFGLVVLESLACGTPVVASDTGGMAEVLRTFAPGLLIAPGDSKSLATLLVQLVDRHESLPSAAACRKFAEGFTWQAAAQQIEAIFRDAIAATHERV